MAKKTIEIFFNNETTIVKCNGQEFDIGPVSEINILRGPEMIGKQYQDGNDLFTIDSLNTRGISFIYYDLEPLKQNKR